MQDLKITPEKAKTYDTESEKNGVFKTPARLDGFGKKQNEYNDIVMENIAELKKRICNLEDEQVKTTDRFRICANELQAFKVELDRMKLTTKLNSNTIDRLTKAIDISKGNVE